MDKLEDFKVYEINELFDDLDTAQLILSKIKGGYSGNFSSCEDFFEAFREELNDLKYQNLPDFSQICLWFAPTSAWDDFVGAEGMELASRVFERASRWNQERL